MSLTQRLLALTLVAALPGLVALTYSAFDLRDTRYAEVRSEALHNARSAVSEINNIFDGIDGVMRAIAQASEVREGDPAACTDYIRRVRMQLKSLTSILIANPDGSVRCYSEGHSPPISLADRHYFHETLTTKKFSVGDYIESRASGRHVVPVALPVLNGSSVAYVVVAGLNIEWFGAQLRIRSNERDSTITVGDRNGIIIAHEPFSADFIGRNFPAGHVDSDREGTRDIHSHDGTERILGYVSASATPFGLYVGSTIPRHEAFASVDRAMRNSMLLFLLGTGVAFALAWLVGESIIRRPLMQMVATAEAWRRGQEAARTGIVNRSDEIGILGQTFDRLMDENARREEEREISESRREILLHELAHRVKNTLATVQSIASLSFRDSQGPDALRRFQERLQALVRSHDLLTRRNWEHAGLLEVAEAALAPVREDRAHRFSISGPPVDLTPASVVPIAMIFHELCTNAMKYGALIDEHGEITVEWTAAPDPRGIVIDLSWSEKGGPPVRAPDYEGFGSKLIRSLTQQMNGEFETLYPPSGMVCKLRLVTPKSEPRHD